MSASNTATLRDSEFEMPAWKSIVSHIAAVLADEAFSSLKAPIKRVTVPNVCMPYAPNAERGVIPNEERIIRVATELLRSKAD